MGSYNQRSNHMVVTPILEPISSKNAVEESEEDEDEMNVNENNKKNKNGSLQRVMSTASSIAAFETINYRPHKRPSQEDDDESELSMSWEESEDDDDEEDE